MISHSVDDAFGLLRDLIFKRILASINIGETILDIFCDRISVFLRNSFRGQLRINHFAKMSIWILMTGQRLGAFRRRNSILEKNRSLVSYNKVKFERISETGLDTFNECL